MNFVFVSLQRIGTDRDSTSTSLAKELGKTHHVLYVNSPIDRRTFYSKTNDDFTQEHVEAIKRKDGDLLFKLQDNLWVLNPGRIIESINWIPFTNLFNQVNWINNYRFAKDIREATKELGFSSYILINDKDIFRSFYLKELLKPSKYIYLDRDNTVAMDYWKRHGVALEPELMKKADAVVCNSNDFTKRARQYNRNSFYIGNGFNVEQYDTTESRPIPADMQDIPKPRIGYVGALITLRLDIEAMVAMAKARPSWSFVLIGPEDEDFQNSELHQLQNVYFLGKKHTSDVPAYIEHFDVCINPQLLNEITIGNFPLKVVEYLAMGRPVVATETNTMKEVFQDYTYLADSTDSFIQQIQKALLQDAAQAQQARKKFVRNFSWQKVTELLLKSIARSSAKETVPILEES